MERSGNFYKAIRLGYILISILIGCMAYNSLYEWQEIEALELGNKKIDELRKEINNINIQMIKFSLLGETNELRNRYMVVNAPEELKAEQVQRIDRTTTEQLTVQVTEQVRTLLFALSNEQLSLRVLMEKVGLKHRPTFLENYITPASEAGFLKVLYPDKPNHPKQKYLLTAKGLALYNEIKAKQ